MSFIEIKNLTKKYGEQTAVDGFSLTVEEGQIFAIVGPDGAGKTSLFRSLCGLLEFTEGEAFIAGYNITLEFDKVKNLLGYMPQDFSLYSDLTVEENLSFYAGLFGLKHNEFEQKKNRLYEFSGLGPFAARRAAMLSGGMKQKLALSCNLIHDPRVLVLDEPTTGVDPLSRRQFWEILKTLRDDGAAIIVATPYMDEVELSDKAIFVHKGRELSQGTPRELASLYKGKVYSIDIFPSREVMVRVNAIAGVTGRRFGAALHVYTTADMNRDELLTNLEKAGIDGTAVSEIPAELEDVFIQLMGEE